MAALPAVVGSLAGQIPVITMAGVTVAYKEAMLPGGKRRRTRRAVPRNRRKNRYSLSSKYSPF